MDAILPALAAVIQPTFLLLISFGVVAGFAVGVLPGFSGPNAAAVLLPFSLALTPLEGLVLITSAYAGAQFAGAVPAILLNVPGTAGAAVTCLDGYPMAQQGKAELAIGIARMASVLGGIIGVVLTVVLLAPMSVIARQVGPPEMFLIAVIALLLIAGSIAGNRMKALIMGLLGMLLAAMSADPILSQERFTFGFPELYESVPLVPVIVGVFAFSEMFLLIFRSYREKHLVDKIQASVHKRGVGKPRRRKIREEYDEVIVGIRVTLSNWVTVLRSSIIGTFLGAVPGIGSMVASMVSYSDTRRRSPHPERFGKGEPQGVIASEATDNSLAAGTLVPTLTLGVPGNATTAVLLAAMYLHGMLPGPRIMRENALEAYGVLAALLVASLLILPLGILLATALTKINRVPVALLVPLVLTISMVGAFAARNTWFDVGFALVVGIGALVLRLGGFPVVPLILGFVLGPLAENNFSRSIQLQHGDLAVFVSTPPSRVLVAVLVAFGLVIIWKTLRRKKRAVQNEVNETI